MGDLSWDLGCWTVEVGDGQQGINCEARQDRDRMEMQG